MTSKLFVKLAADYFGPYSPSVAFEVGSELDSWDGNSIDELWREAKEKISTSYKTPPDIHFIVNSDAYIAKKALARQSKIENNTRRRALPEPEEHHDAQVLDFAELKKSLGGNPA